MVKALAEVLSRISVSSSFSTSKVQAARRHLQMAIDWKGEKLGVFETRRHYTNYFKGIPDFKEYRMKMVTSDEAPDVFAVFDEVQEKFGNYQFV